MSKQMTGMNIAVIGAGYVGLVTGACLSHAGNRVAIMDIDARKIATLQSGKAPIHEAGLEELIQENSAAGRLSFTTSMTDALAGVEIVFIAVGTPPGEDGGADLQYVLGAARQIGLVMEKPLVIVGKSTVPVGTVAKIKDTVDEALAERNRQVDFAVVSNPEFLKEGVAVRDFMRPDRIVLGGASEWALDKMRRLYEPFVTSPEQLVVCDAASAELIKYAANAMLATRISFMNEIANFAEKVGADIADVRRGLASDPRIGAEFLNAGCGYGGSCFPKDVKALVRMAQREGQELHVVRAVDVANEAQKEVVFRKLRDFYEPRGGLKGKTIALWGLAFKPNTDDMREAPSLVLIDDLLTAGAYVRAHDPVAMQEARRAIGEKAEVQLCASKEEALEGADALAIVTEWEQFRNADLRAMAVALRDRIVVDGRNIYSPPTIANAGLTYLSIGRPVAEAVETVKMRLVSAGE